MLYPSNASTNIASILSVTACAGPTAKCAYLAAERLAATDASAGAILHDLNCAVSFDIIFFTGGESFPIAFSEFGHVGAPFPVFIAGTIRVW